MNELLGDPTWWTVAKKAEAERRFSPQIVAAFFDDVQAGTTNPEALRERHLPLPGVSDGYARVLFVGTTGSGKTTILRQLIGSDPDEDRFPSTAPAKTTIADIEVIESEGPYRAIVTFFSEFQVQTYVEECILDAALAANSKAPINRVAERFLNHRDQKFRLSYILGTRAAEGSDREFEDDFESDSEIAPSESDQSGTVSDAERVSNSARIEAYLSRVGTLAAVIATAVAEELGLPNLDVTGEDQEALLELIEEAFENQLYAQDDFHELVQDVLDDIRRRFGFIGSGLLKNSNSGWPETWTFSSDDRDEFIRNIRWFSSNYWPDFGRLLTPVVEGIRVRGPLYPSTRPQGAKLVLIDGQGLGHTPDLTSSVTTHVTRKFEEVDVILLVDNAQQPMQAAPLSVMRAVAISGNHEKLAIAFTHFDQIRGQNLPTVADKRAHVMASVLSAISTLQDVVGARVAKALERDLDNRCFMVGWADRKLSAMPPKAGKYVEAQLNALIAFCETAALPVDEAKAELLYDPVGLPFAVQDGVSKFQRQWSARLGLGTEVVARREHWTRIKALNKRIATEQGVEYDTLRPVADLHTRLLEAISLFLDRPTKDDTADDEQRATMRVRQLVAAQLLRLSRTRLIDQQLQNWLAGYEERGGGSAHRRAVKISAILKEAAPVPSALMAGGSRELLDDLIDLVSKAVEAVGGRMVSQGRGSAGER